MSCHDSAIAFLVALVAPYRKCLQLYCIPRDFLETSPTNPWHAATILQLPTSPITDPVNLIRITQFSASNLSFPQEDTHRALTQH